jgi:hypothetical protein
MAPGVGASPPPQPKLATIVAASAASRARFANPSAHLGRVVFGPCPMLHNYHSANIAAPFAAASRGERC